MQHRLIGACRQKLWSFQNCLILRQLKSTDYLLRRDAVFQLAKSKNIDSHWRPERLEEVFLYNLAKRDWTSLEELGRKAGSHLGKSEFLRFELLRLEPTSRDARYHEPTSWDTQDLIRVIGATESDGARDLLASFLSANPTSAYVVSIGEAGDIGVSVLIQALSSPSANLRIRSIRALGTLNIGKAAQPLYELIKSSSGEEKREILLSLSKLGDGRARLGLLDLPKFGLDDFILIEALIRMQETVRAAERLLSLMESWGRGYTPSESFIRASRLLSSLPLNADLASRAFTAVLPILHLNENRDNREAAADAIWPLFEGRSFEELVGAAISKDTQVNLRAIGYLKGMNDHRLAKVLPLVEEISAEHEKWPNMLRAREGLSEPEPGSWLTGDEQYGLGIHPVQEEVRRHMRWPSKPLIEKALERSCSEYDWPLTKINPKTLYGNQNMGGTT